MAEQSRVLGAYTTMKTLGIDIGSRNTKILIFDVEHRQIAYYAWQTTDINPISSVQALLQQAELATGIKIQQISAIAVTGYGRKLYKNANRILSEISCHAAGSLFYYPTAQTVIDIGGQDSKIICLSDEGKVLDFVMNDKCAAGTGRFLEMTAIRLGVDVSQLSDMAKEADKELTLNSTCVVFAESEIIGMMADNQSAANIVRSVHRSIAKRIFSQMSALNHHPPYVFTGGVAQNPDLTWCLEAELNSSLLLPPEPEITGALGAAILANK